MALDIRAAIAHLSQNPAARDLPLVLYGHSMGAYAAAVAAAECPQVQAVASIAGFNDPMEVMLQEGMQRVGNAAYIGYPFLYLRNLLTFGSLADQSAADAIDRSCAAFLIVHGSGDENIAPPQSIWGQMRQIENENASFLQIDEPLRNGHFGAWLSRDALEEREKIETQFALLQQRYDGDIPQNVLSHFCAQMDAPALLELDENFMRTVTDFYEKAVQ